MNISIINEHMFLILIVSFFLVRDTVDAPKYFEGILVYELEYHDRPPDTVMVYVGRKKIKLESKSEAGVVMDNTIISDDFNDGLYYFFHKEWDLDTFLTGPKLPKDDTYQFKIVSGEACDLKKDSCTLALQIQRVDESFEYNKWVTDSIWFDESLILDLPTNSFSTRILYSAYNRAPLLVKGFIDFDNMYMLDADLNYMRYIRRLISVHHQKLDNSIFDPNRKSNGKRK